MHLEQNFIQFISKQHLFSKADKLLVAVSGGVDSIVLCHLLHSLDYDFAIAHCNFSLRGGESDADADFVKELTVKCNCKLYESVFETEAYASEQKQSIQVAARELRYSYFEKIRYENGFDFILTAHHGSDNVETVTMNFFKGTGIRGLKGILPKNGKIIRPLIFATKASLQEYAAQNDLSYREDSSNASDKYSRNFFRNTILPQVEKVFPMVEQNVLSGISRFQEILQVYEESMSKKIEKLEEQNGNEWKVSIAKLKKEKPLSTVVYELFSAYGFTASSTEEIIKLLDAASGKYIQSSTHRILVNRKWLLVSPLQTEDSHFYLLETDTKKIDFAAGKLEISQPESPVKIDKNADVALLNAKKIAYPLMLRTWKQGDYFYPLGMQKKKKLSRFFIDQKLSLEEKQNAWVLEDVERKILWVVGMRIDDRFKIDPNGTATVVKLRLIPADQKD